MKMEHTDFHHQLTDAVEQNRRISKLAAFRYELNESQTMDSAPSGDIAGREQAIGGMLTLIWQDGSISLHQLTRELLHADSLPLGEWREQRFLHDGYRYFVKPSKAPLPVVPLFDPLIAQAVYRQEMPDLPDGFDATLTVHKRTVTHSKGLQLEDEGTAIRLTPKDLSFPFGHRGRLFPSEREMTYLETEWQWFSRFPLSVSDQLDQVTQETVLLFSPEALGTLIHSGLGVHLTNPASLSLAHSFLEQCATKTSLTLRYDPHVPWALGSQRFSAEGNRTAAVTLLSPVRVEKQVEKPAFLAPHDAFEHKLSPGPSYSQEALRLAAGTVHHFREWLRLKPEVLYIPTLALPESYAPWAEESAWVPEAFLFKRGRPVCRGAFPLSFSLTSILCATEAELVSKIGWDRPGLALPARLLDSTS
ncbi:hypothetical protein [Brevibacillus dissolubilis]|uniref:hypothetical protein n=1 Tax=Brevibacillus dissolubilis TaxID=1844116 RepID=UPI001117731F|nr:hypothetical protein [Brevibacillus dissolubilis]